jgi:hypothetical protein
VSYPADGAMDERETASPLYTYEYLLNPASYWGDFKNLNITVIPPQTAPYIVESSIPMTRAEDGTYMASLDVLPETDLSFTLHADPEIKRLGKLAKNLQRGYMPVDVFAGIIILFLVIIAGGLCITWIVSRKKRKK